MDTNSGLPVWHDDDFSRSKSQTFIVPVNWMLEQILYYHLNGVSGMRIACVNKKLYIEGYDPDEDKTKEITYTPPPNSFRPYRWAEEWPTER